jgi:hypothetical protein
MTYWAFLRLSNVFHYCIVMHKKIYLNTYYDIYKVFLCTPNDNTIRAVCYYNYDNEDIFVRCCTGFNDIATLASNPLLNNIGYTLNRYHIPDTTMFLCIHGEVPCSVSIPYMNISWIYKDTIIINPLIYLRVDYLVRNKITTICNIDVLVVNCDVKYIKSLILYTKHLVLVSRYSFICLRKYIKRSTTLKTVAIDTLTHSFKYYNVIVLPLIP